MQDEYKKYFNEFKIIQYFCSNCTEVLETESEPFLKDNILEMHLKEKHPELHPQFLKEKKTRQESDSYQNYLESEGIS